jgi:cytoskeletal protein RodZ
MESIGQYLRHERELRGIGLDEVADTTRIPVRQLERLEDGRTAELPGEVFVKGYLKAYARAIGLKQDDVLARYANTLRISAVSPVTVRVSSVPPERGKRFGLAIALVVFAILATLAMSFLLRPRTQERPEQLSWLGGTKNAVSVSCATLAG